MTEYHRNTDVADEQLTVPEDREEAAAAEGRSTAAEVEDGSERDRDAEAELEREDADGERDRDHVERDWDASAERDREDAERDHDEVDSEGELDDVETVAGTTAEREPASMTQSPPTNSERPFELFGGSDRDDYRRRWEAVQASFVDDPKGAAEQADALVGELVDHVTRRHRELHDEVGGSTDQGDTEAMRIALRQYRTFFHTLVGA